MRKKTSMFVAMALLLFSITSWSVVIYSHYADQQDFQQLLKQGDNFFQKGIYIDAIDVYQQALIVRPKDKQLWLKIAEANRKLGNESAFLDACHQAYLISPKDPKPIIEKAKYYIESKKVQQAYHVLSENQSMKQNREIKRMLDSLKGKYENLYAVFDEIKSWHGSYTVASLAGKAGLLATTGENPVPFRFDEAGAFSSSEGVMPVKENGEWIYVDMNGNRKLVADKPYDFLGTFSEGMAPAKRGNQYGYINRSFKESAFHFAYTGSYANGVAAVKNQDGKWTLINRKFQPVSKWQFDEILLDDNGFCSKYGVVFVRQNGSVFLIDLRGEKITKKGYEDAKGFVSNEAAAVKIDGHWGFVDKKGKIVIEPKFEDADSFTIGLAPVKQNGLWGYLDQKGKMVIEPTFTKAKPFSKKGIAAVQLRNSWRLIQLITKQE